MPGVQSRRDAATAAGFRHCGELCEAAGSATDGNHDRTARPHGATTASPPQSGGVAGPRRRPVAARTRRRMSRSCWTGWCRRVPARWRRGGFELAAAARSCSGDCSTCCPPTTGASLLAAPDRVRAVSPACAWTGWRARAGVTVRGGFVHRGRGGAGRRARRSPVELRCGEASLRARFRGCRARTAYRLRASRSTVCRPDARRDR